MLGKTYILYPMSRINVPSEVVTHQQLHRCRRSFQGWLIPVWHARRWPLDTASKSYLDERQKPQHSSRTVPQPTTSSFGTGSYPAISISIGLKLFNFHHVYYRLLASIASQTMHEGTPAEFRIGFPTAHISDKSSSVLYCFQIASTTLNISPETYRDSFVMVIPV